mmetsp:Transcript_3932/g.7455  ORF Transcript_3932/g.7455 Transcript_3932/m.7455 type:complete len:258 (-) Transcript_3932:1542-2315(-)
MSRRPPPTLREKYIIAVRVDHRPVNQLFWPPLQIPYPIFYLFFLARTKIVHRYPQGRPLAHVALPLSAQTDVKLARTVTGRYRPAVCKIRKVRELVITEVVILGVDHLQVEQVIFIPKVRCEVGVGVSVERSACNTMGTFQPRQYFERIQASIVSIEVVVIQVRGRPSPPCCVVARHVDQVEPIHHNLRSDLVEKGLDHTPLLLIFAHNVMHEWVNEKVAHHLIRRGISLPPPARHSRRSMPVVALRHCLSLVGVHS